MTSLVLLESAELTAVQRLLEALGVVFERRSLAQALQLVQGSSAPRPALILSEEQLVRAAGVGADPETRLQELLSRYRHILVYPFRGSPDGLRALSTCVEGQAEAAPVSATAGPYSVVSGFTAAGPFQALSVSVRNSQTDRH